MGARFEINSRKPSTFEVAVTRVVSQTLAASGGVALTLSIYTPTPVVRGLLDLRLLIGRLFGRDSPRPSTQAAPRTTIAWLCDRILY